MRTLKAAESCVVIIPAVPNSAGSDWAMHHLPYALESNILPSPRSPLSCYRSCDESLSAKNYYHRSLYRGKRRILLKQALFLEWQAETNEQGGNNCAGGTSCEVGGTTCEVGGTAEALHTDNGVGAMELFELSNVDVRLGNIIENLNGLALTPTSQARNSKVSACSEDMQLTSRHLMLDKVNACPVYGMLQANIFDCWAMLMNDYTALDIHFAALQALEQRLAAKKDSNEDKYMGGTILEDGGTAKALPLDKTVAVAELSELSDKEAQEERDIERLRYRVWESNRKAKCLWTHTILYQAAKECLSLVVLDENVSEVYEEQPSRQHSSLSNSVQKQNLLAAWSMIDSWDLDLLFIRAQIAKVLILLAQVINGSCREQDWGCKSADWSGTPIFAIFVCLRWGGSIKSPARGNINIAASGQQAEALA